MGLIHTHASKQRDKAQAKEAKATAKLAKAERKQLSNQRGPANQWDDILAGFESGEITWEDLGRMQKMQMPIGYQIKCKAAERKANARKSVDKV